MNSTVLLSLKGNKMLDIIKKPLGPENTIQPLWKAVIHGFGCYNSKIGKLKWKQKITKIHKIQRLLQKNQTSFRKGKS